MLPFAVAQFMPTLISKATHVSRQPLSVSRCKDKSAFVVPKAKVLGCEAKDFPALRVAIETKNYGVSLLAVTIS